jgi:glutathione peroxidase
MKAKYIHLCLRAVIVTVFIAGGINMLSARSIYDFSLSGIAGGELDLADYRGKVLLIVNTASKCGFTKQYDGLQKLWETYRDQGLVVLGFPANNFLNQEPGDNEEIANFCRINYGVSFPLSTKISVRGKNIHPLYKYLTEKETNPSFSGKISWNFNKFLVSREGVVINRFGSKVEPGSEELVAAIEEALKP